LPASAFEKGQNRSAMLKEKLSAMLSESVFIAWNKMPALLLKLTFPF
jgi:hypothetical protein